MEKNLILFFLIINSIICNSIENNYNDKSFLDWGIKNNIEYLPVIEISSENGQKKFIAKEDIDPNNVILKIPYDLTFNIEKALDLINIKELKLQYDQFKKLDIPTYIPHHINLQKEEIFLSYILYIIQHELGNYNSTKFYEKYNLYLSSLDYYRPKSPLFYAPDQIEYLQGTYLAKFHDRIKKLFQEEIKVFKNESYYNKEIDFKEYAYNRLAIENKGLEILGHISMIPFLNYFDRDYMKNNAEFNVLRNGDVKIVTKVKIKKGETIIVNSPKRTNVERMIFEGELNNYSAGYKENYLMPVFSPGLFYKYDIDDINLFSGYSINLVDLDFEKRAIELYKKYIKINNADEGDIWAYKILLENINYYQDYIEKYLKKRLDKIFEDDYDRKTVEKALNGEIKILKKASNLAFNNMEHYKNKEKKKSSDL